MLRIMKNRYIVMLIGALIGFSVASIIVGEIQWGLLIGLLVGISIMAMLTKNREKNGEVETDERIKYNYQKFMLFVMGSSLFLLLIYLVISEFILKQQFIEVKYLTYYVLGTFLLSVFIGPAIIKRK